MMKKIQITALTLVLLASNALAAPDGYQDASLPLYREAFEKMVNGNYAEAIASFEALITAFPESTRSDDAAYNIGYCLEKLNDLSEAFEQYRSVINEYPDSISAKKAERRAVSLSQRLRTTKGDPYDQFLVDLYQREKSHEQRRIAMRMAQIGDWRGLDLLIESLEEGSAVEQINAAELLARKVEIQKVNNALKRAMLESKNPIVRGNALRGLYRLSGNAEVREALTNVLLKDPSELLRSTAARSLGRFIDTDSDIRAAFDEAILHESHPMVLQRVLLISLHSKSADDIRKKMVARLGRDEDPMVQFMLSSALGEELKETENKALVEILVNNPEPMVRINALRTLQPRAEEPDIKVMFVEKLKNDPDTHVRVTALNALKGEAVKDGDVRDAVVTILRESDDAVLVTTSIHFVQRQVELPEVRNELINVLHRADQPVIAGQAAFALLPEIALPEVREVLIGRLTEPAPFEVKYAVSSALLNAPSENSEYIVAALKPLYLEEKNAQLAINYLRAIQRMDPAAAAELVKKRKISGYSYEFTFEVKKDREKR